MKTLSFLLAHASLVLAVSAGAADANRLSLAGEWRFALDPAAEQREVVRTPGPVAPLPEGDGIAQKWYARELTEHIKLPGILQAQGFGNDISVSTPWILTLGDAWWKLQDPALREHFSKPGHVEVPFLSQPPKHYLGVAWYQREIDVPASWKGRRVSLFLERPHWETRVWIDDHALPANDSLVAPHVSDLGILTPGQHQLTVRVDNRQLLRDPKDDGHSLDGHSVSDALGASWNGIVGRIELQSTSPVWLDDVQIFPRAAEKSALVKIQIGNATGTAGRGVIVIGDRKTDVEWDSAGGRAEVSVALGENAKLWDEFHPHLQHLKVALHGENIADEKEITFGLRDVSHRERDLLINGRVVNLRLNHFGGDFPLTGYPATDVESWRHIIRVCQSFGMNGIRFHSWCPPDAAFVAADELGFYLQPECGLWAPFNVDSVYTKFLEAETARLLKAFGNHPSFILLSPSNEPGGHYQKVTPAWAVRWYERDERRLYAAGTGWSDPAQVNGGAQYAALVRYGGGELRNRTGWFGADFRKAVETSHIPIFSHEVGQWCAYPDFDVIKEFTGYMRPSNYDIFRYIAKQEGVLEENHAFASASGKFQLACYKEEIEANLRTPNLAGYQLLDLHDYLGQGTALIGVLDAFWKPKSYVTAREFSRFNNAVVPLVRLARRTFTTAETLTAEAELYNFGEKPLEHARAYWKINDSRGQTVAHGQWAENDYPIGKNLSLGTINTELKDLPAPGAYKLVVGVEGPALGAAAYAKPGEGLAAAAKSVTAAENDWNFWVYPARPESMATSAAESASSGGSARSDSPASEGTSRQGSAVLETKSWSDAAAALAKGEKVLFVPAKNDLDPARCPTMASVPVFWNIQMTVRPPRNPQPKFDAMLGLLCDTKHPALGEFPTEANCDWQWTPLVAGVRSVNLRNAPRDLRPIVAAIDDWNRNWRLGVIFECRVGPGKLLVSTIDVSADAAAKANAPVGLAQLRRSLLDYAVSAKFKPKAKLTEAEANALWEITKGTAAPQKPRAIDRDLDDGSGSSRGPRTGR
ncbi:MAG TPA: hypothetical protein VFT72_02075 [Opitutaceae bacterium]|nr:hypothetical protein [Opitutaceae bacterium]